MGRPTKGRAESPSPGAKNGAAVSTANGSSAQPDRKAHGAKKDGASGVVPVPPQVLPLALANIGMCGNLTAWGKLHKLDAGSVPGGLALLSLSLLLLYGTNALRAPHALNADFANPLSLPALNAGQAAATLLTARFGTMLPTGLAPTIVTLLFACGFLICGRFLRQCYRQKLLPDPSWYPATLLTAGSVLSSQTVGPDFLKVWSHTHFAVTVAVLFPLGAVVTYRILFSKVRDSVSPHAGMALLMSPFSLFAFIYMNIGKPFGDGLGHLLFALSSGYFFITLRMLYQRRQLWSNAFHPSYVGFTFPLASTATAALLASHHLPVVASLGMLATLWAALLTIVAMAVVLGITAKLLIDVLTSIRAGGSAAGHGAATGAKKGAAGDTSTKKNK